MHDLQIPTPTVDDYANADTLPAAVALNRQFIRYERHWSRTRLAHLAPEQHGEYMRDLDAFAATLDAATRIWQDEQEAVRARIAARIRAELPDAENFHIPQAVESNDYTLMAC